MKSRAGLHGLLAGALAGIAGGLFGVGGGVIMVPLLTGPLGFTQHQAHGTSLAVIGVAAFVSAIVYALHGNVAWLPAVLTAATSMITARYGARLARRTRPQTLSRIFVVFLLVVAVRLLWKAPEPTAPAFHGGAASIAVYLVLGLAVGLLAGYMGIGGGILIVPALTMLIGLPQQLAQGTSLAVVVAVAPVGAIEHARHGNVVRSMILTLALGAIVGGALASLFVQRLPGPLLARGFALFLLATAVQTWIRADRAARREAAAATG